jgi:hypothetical protein
MSMASAVEALVLTLVVTFGEMVGVVGVVVVTAMAMVEVVEVVVVVVGRLSTTILHRFGKMRSNTYVRVSSPSCARNELSR